MYPVTPDYAAIMETIKFTKMHGIGNDYVYVDCTKTQIDNPQQLSREVSPRHTGIGADGLILILPSEKADFKMRIFNADGSEAMMCGNGSRCVGKYVHDHGLTARTKLTLETLSGVKHLTLHISEATGKVDNVTVDMGKPDLTQPEGLPDRLTAVSMGNPHAVMFLNHQPDDAHVLGQGPELERHPCFPDRANIEFAHVVSPSEIEMRVWERGSGETMACGTGACATAVAAAHRGLTGREVTIHLRGGDLHIVWDPATNHVLMTGPATEVFSGNFSSNV